nr:hypothetical protein [Mucilaginibacter sp. SP1R1]MBB6151806.1 hypothetical protein [Mucilaginibacter sp. SP1R1]
MKKKRNWLILAMLALMLIIGCAGSRKPAMVLKKPAAVCGKRN